MNKFTYKLATAASTAALALGSFGPSVLGATNITINGNGSDSDNEVEFSQSNTTQVSQHNTADIENNVDANASTGGNSASRNTGGDVSVDTGNATSNVEVTNNANSNVAHVDGCCVSDVNLKIAGNGDDSENTIDLAGRQGISNSVRVDQTNDADVENDIDANASTGYNDADRNTGGDVRVETGNATTNVKVGNNLNSNWLSVGGGNGGSVDVEISGNGSDSDNEVELDLENTVWATQHNDADVENNVDANATSGGNDADRNTGGDVSIDTGNASVDVEVANMANFNADDLSGCDCELDVTVDVTGNGDDSDSDVNLDITSELGAEQTNDFDCDGGRGGQGPEIFSFIGGNHGGNCADVDANAKTGHNDADRNTGEADGDPSVTTGDASTDVEVENNVNSNIFGDVDFDMPEIDWDFDGFVFWLMAHSS
jgi:hypothetical protein